MTVRILAVHERAVPIRSTMSNAAISFAEMTVSLVAVVTSARRNGRQVIGYGFNSNGRYAQSGPLRERFIPRLLAADPLDIADASGENLDPERAWDVLVRNEKPGGHGDRSVAVGILDMAIWDATAKIEERPLAAVLASRYGSGRSSDRVDVYAAGGYYQAGEGTQSLVDEMRGYLDLGYTSLKMKIGGAPLAEDLRRIDAVLRLLPKPDRLAVDANARFDPPTAHAYAEALGGYGLRWFEEPLDPLDYAGHAELAAEYPGAIATGENLFATVEVVNLLRHGGLRPGFDVLQMDPVFSYGVVGYVRMLEAVERAGWSRRRCIPHGGHQLNVAVAAGLGLDAIEAYPAVFAPFGGFADDQAVEAGTIVVGDAPGIGIERKSNLYALARELVADAA